MNERPVATPRPPAEGREQQSGGRRSRGSTSAARSTTGPAHQDRVAAAGRFGTALTRYRRDAAPVSPASRNGGCAEVVIAAPVRRYDADQGRRQRTAMASPRSSARRAPAHAQCVMWFIFPAKECISRPADSAAGARRASPGRPTNISPVVSAWQHSGPTDRGGLCGSGNAKTCETPPVVLFASGASVGIAPSAAHASRNNRWSASRGAGGAVAEEAWMLWQQDSYVEDATDHPARWQLATLSPSACRQSTVDQKP